MVTLKEVVGSSRSSHTKLLCGAVFSKLVFMMLIVKYWYSPELLKLIKKIIPSNCGYRICCIKYFYMSYKLYGTYYGPDFWLLGGPSSSEHVVDFFIWGVPKYLVDWWLVDISLKTKVIYYSLSFPRNKMFYVDRFCEKSFEITLQFPCWLSLYTKIILSAYVEIDLFKQLTFDTNR